MRGEAVAGPDALGGGPATRSLLELDIGGRTSRNSGGELPASASARGYVRPGSGLGRPLGRAEGGPNIYGGQVTAGGPGAVGFGRAGQQQQHQQQQQQAGGGGGGLAPLGDGKGHKSRHSLAGTMGKFAGGFARGSGSRDRKEAGGDGKGDKKEKR